MKKQIRSLIIVALIVILLSGVLLFFALNPKEESVTSEAPTDSKITLWEYTDDKISKIHVENENETFDIEQGGEDGLIIKDLESLPGNTLAYSAAKSLSTFSVSQLVEEKPEDISIYGLDKPAASVEISFSDGKSKKLLVGNSAPKTATVYVKVDGEDPVYVIDESYISISQKTKKDFLSLNVTGISDDPTNIDVQKIVYSGIIRETEIVVEKTPDTGSEQQKMGLTSGMTITSPLEIDVDYEKIEPVVKSAIELKATHIEEIMPTDEQLEEFGLKEPVSTMDVTYVHMKTGTDNNIVNEDGQYKILLGNAVDDFGYYAMREGSPIVFYVKADSVPWIRYAFTDISSKIQFMPYIDDISSIKINTKTKEYIFDLKTTFEESEAAESGESQSDPKKTLTVTGNGKDIEAESFRTLYQLIISCIGDQVLEVALEEDAFMSITYSYVDSSKKDVIVALVPIDDRNYAIVVDGIALYGIRGGYVEALLSNCEKAINGEEVSSSWS